MLQAAKKFVPFGKRFNYKLGFPFANGFLHPQKSFFCTSQDKSAKGVDANQHSNSQNERSETNLYEKNLQELKEISKEVFAKIEKYTIKKKYEIFLTYSAYHLIDPDTYNIIEKDFIKNLNGFTSEQLICILEGLVKIQMGSPKLQMLMEQYFVKNIHNLSIKECVRLAKVLPKAFSFREDASPTTSKRLSESIHLFFMNKLNDFTSLQKIQTTIGLLQLLKSKRSMYVESLELVFERLSHKIATFNKQELVLFGHLFFSHFLMQREVQLNKREKALDSVNQIMYGRIELTENALKQSSAQVVSSLLDNQQSTQNKVDVSKANLTEEFQNSLLNSSKILFDQKTNFRLILKSFNACILKNISDFHAKDYFKILEIYELQETPIDAQIKQHFDQYVKDNYLDFSPKELYSLSHYIDLRFIHLYLDHYKQDLEYIDLLNFFKNVQMQSQPSYEQALRIVDKRSIEICEKWDLDEVVYILCSREDQHIQFANNKLFQREREEFLIKMMLCINKELRIRSRNPFKIYYTLWKLLFRSQTKLNELYMVDLLQNMGQNIFLSNFDQFMKIVEIINHIIKTHPEFEVFAKSTLAKIEDKYTINMEEGEAKKLGSDETKKIGQ